MIPVILPGDSGLRLWPLSRKQYPKQFLVPIGDDTLFQQTIKCLTFDGMQAPLLMRNKEHRSTVRGQLGAQNLTSQTILLEPFDRSAASAVAIAVMKPVAEGRDELLPILPIDHVIEDQHAFQRALALATNAAEGGETVPFDIPASRPETGYGYIRASANAQLSKDVSWVQSFVEKPDEARTREFVVAGGYYWNSGMFPFRASRYLEELKKCGTDIYDTYLLALKCSQYGGNLVSIGAATFECCPDNSIDCVMIEKILHTYAMPLFADWNDVGGWSSIWDVHAKDANGGVIKDDVLIHDSHNCLVHGNDKSVPVIGLEDTMIVKTKDAMMVAHKDRVRDVKHVVKDLGAQGRSGAQNHCGVYRPQGSYDSVNTGGRFQVKYIVVKPDARLLLQMYHHRVEHWIMVFGAAQVTCNDKTFLLTEDQSTYIPIASTHRLANPGEILLEIIRVQSGNYLDEDDIERLEDVYGRTVEPIL